MDRTPLYIACENGHVDVVNALLSRDGIDVNQAETIRMERHHCMDCVQSKWPFGSCECTVKYGWDRCQ